MGENNIVSYQIVAGHNYALTTADSKRYQYDMEHIGGKFAIVTDEITQWLSSLWHGRRLAYTLAILSICIALVCFLVAQHPDYKLPADNNEK
ncbi:MAG: hypothetical protein WDM70_09345 [Nitrosomonadales bacterium]